MDREKKTISRMHSGCLKVFDAMSMAELPVDLVRQSVQVWADGDHLSILAPRIGAIRSESRA